MFLINSRISLLLYKEYASVLHIVVGSRIIVLGAIIRDPTNDGIYLAYIARILANILPIFR